MIALWAAVAWAAPEVDVFWPEVHGRGKGRSRAMASLVAAEMATAVREAGGTPRPADEGVEDCPSAGCLRARVTAVVIHEGDGCVVLAAVGPQGTTPSLLVPWVGRWALGRLDAPFGEPIATSATVHDFGSCDALPSSLRTGRPALVSLLQTLVR